MDLVATVPPHSNESTWRSRAASITGYERAIQLLSAGMIVSSTFMRADISVGIGNVYPANIIALSMFPLAFWQTQTVRGVRRALLISFVISVVATFGSLAMPDPSSRYRLLGQLALNAFTMLVAVSLLSHLSRTALRQLVVFLCWTFFAAALLQVALAPHWNVRGTSTLGIARPVLFFNEEGYVGMFAAFLLCAALALHAPFAAFLAATLVVIADNRGAYFVAFGAVLLAIPWIQSRRVLRNIIFIIPILLGLIFALSTWLDWPVPILKDNGVLTRYEDTQAILRYNDNSLLPWGGHVLDVLDRKRERQVNDTLNIWLTDLVWKFGFGGLVIVTTWMWAFLSGIPKRIAPCKSGDAYWVPLGALFGHMANLQFNNPSGHSWTWVMVGMLYAVMASSTSRDGLTTVNTIR